MQQPQTLYVGHLTKDGPAVSALDAQSGTMHWHTVFPHAAFPIYNTSQKPLQAAHGVVYMMYTAASSNFPNADTLDALRASDGQLLWRYQVKNQWLHTMVVRDDVIYLGLSLLSPSKDVFLESRVEALQATDGKRLWQYSSADLSRLDQLEATNELLYLLTTKVINDGSDGGRNTWPDATFEALATIHALRVGDGSEAWQATYKSGMHLVQAAATSSVLCVFISGLNLWNSHKGYDIEALRASDGALLWRTQTDDVLDAGTLVRKAARGDLLYLVEAISNYVTAFSTTDGTLRWRINDFNNDVALQASTDVIYATNSQQVSAFQADNGKKLWSVACQNPTSFIAASDASVYVASGLHHPAYSATLYALRKRDGEKLWDHSIDGEMLALALEV